jgi:hypothetical protein
MLNSIYDLFNTNYFSGNPGQGAPFGTPRPPQNQNV